MEYLQKCFYNTTGWNEDNIFSNITATSQSLLEFNIPNGMKLDISSKSTEHLASSFTLTNHHSINGSIAYLYSSLALKNTMGTKDVSLQDAISGFRIIEPKNSLNYNPPKGGNDRNSMLYGRMYFPGSALEAMVIKRLSSQTQLLLKCISNPQLNKNGTMIVYLQKNTPRYLREFIYSTNEALFGFRCLYNLNGGSTSGGSGSQLIPKFDNSVMSIGTEVWYAALSTSPGLSTAFRYSTRSTSTGKPLTMTLACNPILGHISSTYTVKTSVSSTFSSKYDFNWFSYASNLSLGFELYNYSNEHQKHNFADDIWGIQTDNGKSPIEPTTNAKNNRSKNSRKLSSSIKKGEGSQHTQIDPLTFDPYKDKMPIVNPIQNLDNYYHINPTLLPSRHEHDQLSDGNMPVDSYNASVMTAFQNLVNESDFASVLKISTSMNDRMLKVLWEGRFKDFLASTGVQLSLNSQTLAPEIGKFGLSLSYAC